VTVTELEAEFNPDAASEEFVDPPFNPTHYVKSNEFHKSVENKLKARLENQKAQEIENNIRFPFAAKMMEGGLEDVLSYYEEYLKETPQYLIEDFMPRGSYGVLAAQEKAGKTWIVVDLIVTGILCGLFLSRFQFVKPKNDDGTDRDIRFALFFNEGDKREFFQRLDAVAKSYGSSAKEIVESGQLLVQFRPPNLTDPDEIQKIHGSLKKFGADLTIIDPWYLSAGDSDSKNLQSMGLVLRNIQGVCQDVGSALLIMHHWNKTGEGDSFKRATGAGLLEWGRFLVNLAIVSETIAHPEDITGRTSYQLKMEFKGQVSGAYAFTRDVWREDRKDLASPMHYELSSVEGVAKITDKVQSKDEKFVEIFNSILNMVKIHPCEWSKTQIVEAVRMAVGVSPNDVTLVAGFIERYKIVGVVRLDKDDTRNKTGRATNVWDYLGDDFTDMKRMEFAEKLNEDWEVYRKENELEKAVKARMAKK